MQLLVSKPFLAASSTIPVSPDSPYLVTIDGLDECEDCVEFETLIEGMLLFFQENPDIPLRILITSRMEEHIRKHLQNDEVSLENLADRASNADTKTFLCSVSSESAKRSRVIQSYGGGGCCRSLGESMFRVVSIKRAREHH